MSDSLRDALEELAENWGPTGVGSTVRALLAAHPAEPVPVVTDDAVNQAAGAMYTFETDIAWSQIDPFCSTAGAYRERARVAVEAAAPLLSPRPLLDRDAVTAIFRGHYQQHGPGVVSGKPFQSRCACGVEYGHGKFNAHLADAVMELARPMPTREQIEEEVQEALGDLGIVAYPTNARNDAEEPVEVECVSGHVAGFMLALLNGGAK